MQAIILTLTLAFYACSTQAQIVVNNALITLNEEETTFQQVLVKNTSKTQPLIVKFVAEEVINMDKEDEKRIPTNKIIVVPPFLQLAPQTHRPIKIIKKASKTKSDRFFRVKVIPETPNNSPLETNLDKRNQHIQVLTGTGILITVLPQEPYEDISIERTLEKIIFTNNSNTFAVLRPYVCNIKNCAYQPAPRIHPGDTWTTPIPAGMEFEDINFEKRFAGKITTIRVPYTYE